MNNSKSEAGQRENIRLDKALTQFRSMPKQKREMTIYIYIILDFEIWTPSVFYVYIYI